MTKAIACKLNLKSSANNNICVYQLQIDGINKENENEIKNIMAPWKFLAFIYSIKKDDINLTLKKDDTSYGLLYKNEFLSEELWEEWCKSFPYSLEEIKIIKLPVITETEEKQIKKKRCSYCLKYGHNIRTCPIKKMKIADF